eukprot:gene7980-9375_t
MSIQRNYLLLTVVVLLTLCNVVVSINNSHQSEQQIDIIDDNEQDRHRVEDVNALINFAPYSGDSTCQSEIHGVGFGSLPFQCSINASGLFYSIMPMFNGEFNVEYNVSTSYHEYCYDNIYSEVYAANNSCHAGPVALENYVVYKQDWPPKIPNNAVVYLSMYGFCSRVASYWFATNGTSVIDVNGNLTTYICNQGKPFTEICSPTSLDNTSSSSCTLSPIDTGKCTITNPQEVYCGGHEPQSVLDLSNGDYF